MKYILSLCDWGLWSALGRVAGRVLPGRWARHFGLQTRHVRALRLECWITELARGHGLAQWSFSPEGCDFAEAVFAEHLDRFAKSRRAEAEEIRSKPFVMPTEMPPVSPKRFPEIRAWERRRYDEAFENAERALVVETARMERLRRFGPGDWRRLVVYLWRLTARGFVDRMFFRPASPGTGRKVELTLGPTRYAFECDIAVDRVDCRMTYTGEAEPVDDESYGHRWFIALSDDEEDSAWLAQA